MDISMEQLDEFCKSFYPNWVVVDSTNRNLIRIAYRQELNRIFNKSNYSAELEKISITELGVFISGPNQTDLGITDFGILVARSTSTINPTTRISFGKATQKTIQRLIDNLEQLKIHATD